MIRSPAILVLLGMLPALQAESDLLRFANGDQLHGSFLGMTDNGAIRFLHKEMKDPAEFRLDTLRHVVLRGGKPAASATTLTHVVLTNGDRLPGTLVALDDSHLTLDTGFMGLLRIPRTHVATLAVHPLGGRVHYHGPFSDDGWSILRPANHNTEPHQPAATDWQFSGSAWYWKGAGAETTRSGSQNRTALVRREGLSDRSVMRFRLDWRDSFAIGIAFHADFATGDPARDDDNRKQSRAQGSVPAMFGNAYVLQMYPGYVMLHRSVWDPGQGPQYERIQTGATSLRLNDTRSALVEIRGNRRNGRISLFINDEFLAQWNEPPHADNDHSYSGKGNGFGFTIQQSSGSLRISEILVSDWNGLPDSARSMELEDRDVVLMNNGVDRFSGDAGTLDAAGALGFKSRHGSMSLPVADISEVHFARKHLTTTRETAGHTSTLHLHPVGRITARLLSGDSSKLRILHPLLGEADCRTDPLVMIEYQTGSRTSDVWNDDL